MSTFSIGSFSARLGIDTSGWSGGLTAANAVTSVFGQHVTNFMTNPVLGAVGAMGALTRGIISAGDAALSQAEAMLLTERTTGLTLEQIQAYTHALADAGLGTEALREVTVKFADSIADARAQAGPARDALKSLGLDPAELEPGARSLSRVLEALGQIRDEGQRIDIARDLLGRGGGGAFAAVVSQSDDLIERMRRASRIIDSDVIRSVGNLDDKVDRVRGTFQGLKDTLTFEFLAAIDQGIGEFGGPEKLAEAIKTKLVPEVVAFGTTVGRIADRMDQMAQKAEAIGKFLSFVTVEGLREEGAYGARSLIDMTSGIAAQRRAANWGGFSSPGVLNAQGAFDLARRAMR